jgi:IclR family acetate operon transcriptional repressor
MATPKNQSVVKAFSLLQSFTRPNEWLTSAELSRRANLPQASGYRMVQTLEEIGAIIRDSRGRYGPGMLLLDLSHDIAPLEIWSKVASGILEDLAGGLGVTAHVGVLDNGMVTYVAKAGSGSAAVRTFVGAQLEAYCTAIGKVLLATLPEPELDAFLDDGDLIALTERTITDREAFRLEAARVRAQGYAFDDGETADDVVCLAAPIRNRAGRTVAAVSISDERTRLLRRPNPELLDRLQQAAGAIGARLYRGANPRSGFCPARRHAAEEPLARAS